MIFLTGIMSITLIRNVSLISDSAWMLHSILFESHIILKKLETEAHSV